MISVPRPASVGLGIGKFALSVIAALILLASATNSSGVNLSKPSFTLAIGFVAVGVGGANFCNGLRKIGSKAGASKDRKKKEDTNFTNFREFSKCIRVNSGQFVSHPAKNETHSAESSYRRPKTPVRMK